MPGEYVEKVFSTLACGHVVERTVPVGTVGYAVGTLVMCRNCANKRTCVREVKRT